MTATPTSWWRLAIIGVSPSVEQVREPITPFLSACGSSSRVRQRRSFRFRARWWASGTQRSAVTSETRPGPVSVVGVGRFSVEVAEDQSTWSWKLANWLTLLAGLNMALFFFNLIPLLPLDGGHVAGALYEGARRQIATTARQARPRPGRRRPHAAGRLHGGVPPDRHVGAAHLRRPREPDHAELTD